MFNTTTALLKISVLYGSIGINGVGSSVCVSMFQQSNAHNYPQSGIQNANDTLPTVV